MIHFNSFLVYHTKYFLSIQWTLNCPLFVYIFFTSILFMKIMFTENLKWYVFWMVWPKTKMAAVSVIHHIYDIFLFTNLNLLIYIILKTHLLFVKPCVVSFTLLLVFNQLIDFNKILINVCLILFSVKSAKWYIFYILKLMHISHFHTRTLNQL